MNHNDELNENRQSPAAPDHSPLPPNGGSSLPSAETTASEAAEATAVKAVPVQRPDGRARAKKLLAILLISLVVLLLLNLIPFDKMEAAVSDLPVETEPAVTYGDNFFKIPDYNEDVNEDEIYQTKYNRLLTFESGGEAFSVTADTAATHGKVCLLFQNYMETLTAGDTAACDALFTDDYLAKNGASDFAPQKIYDMTVKVVRSQYLEDGDANGSYKGYTVTYCEVSYKIRDNNGTLRRDFFREGDTVPLIFEVLEKGDYVRINGISAIQSGDNTSTESKGESIVMYTIWIAVIALAIIIEASTATLTAIWFMPGALVSLILALCGLSVTVQVVVFATLSLICLIVGMTLIRKRLKMKKPVPTNADRLIGMDGVVSEAIDNVTAKGEVKADGKRWSARSEDGSAIEEGAIVTILRIEGVKLIVEKKK